MGRRGSYKVENKMKLLFKLFFVICIGLQAFSNVLVVSGEQRKFSLFTEKLIEFGKKSTVNYEKKSFSKDTDYKEFESYVKSRPDTKIIITVDNKYLSFLKKYNEKNKPVRGISVLALNLEEQLKDETNIAGIRYEPSAFSLFSSLRYNVLPDAKKLLVIYRSSVLKKQIEKASKELKFVGGELVKLDVMSFKGEELKDKLKMALKQTSALEYDAIWVPLDSVLLSPELFINQWLPFTQNQEKPIVVQSESLADVKLNFATYAVSPNLFDLADQTKQLVELVLSGKSDIKTIGIEESISIQKYINTKMLNDLGIKLRNDLEDIVYLRK